MSTVPNTPDNSDRINDTVVEAAIAALKPFGPDSPQAAADMLLFWARRTEMTKADLAEIQRRMFPVDDTTVRRAAERLAELGYEIDPSDEPADLTERINALLAEGIDQMPESEWMPPPACPSWCTRHVDDGPFRECGSEEMFVPQFDNGVACVDVSTSFDRATGRGTPVLVGVEDLRFTPQYARHLAMLLVRAAELAERGRAS